MKKNLINRIISITLVASLMLTTFAFSGYEADAFSLKEIFNFGESQQDAEATQQDDQQSVQHELTSPIEYNGEPLIRGVYQGVNYYYSDGYFLSDSKSYDEHISSMSMALAVSRNKENASGFLTAIGCEKIKYAGYVNDVADNVAYVYGSKTLKEGTKDECVLIPIYVRGIYYDAEWQNNFLIGTSGDAKGFGDNARRIKEAVDQYITDNEIDKSKVRIWTTGFSRGGGIANILGRLYTDELGADRVYSYAMAAPMGGDPANGSSYPNLHRVANYNDIVTLAAPAYMGFKSYGDTHFIGNDSKSGFKDKEAKMLQWLDWLDSDLREDYISPSDFTWAKIKVPSITLSNIIKISNGEYEYYSDIDTEHKQGNSFREALELALTRVGTSALVDRAAYAETIPNDVKKAADAIGVDNTYTVQDCTIDMYKIISELDDSKKDALTDGLIDFAKNNISLVLDIKNYLTDKEIPYYVGYGRSYSRFVYKIWASLESYIPAEYRTTVKKALPIALYTFAAYSSIDYNKDRQTIGAVAYNIKMIAPLHSGPTYQSWVISEDGYYDSDYDNSMLSLSASNQTETRISGLDNDTLEGTTIVVKNPSGAEIAKIENGEITSFTSGAVYVNTDGTNIDICVPASNEKYKIEVTPSASADKNDKYLRISNRIVNTWGESSRVASLHESEKSKYYDIKFGADDKLSASINSSACTITHKIEKKSATCTTAGNEEYWHCDHCGKYFSDEACTKEIKENSWIINPTGHKNKEKTEAAPANCTEDGNTAYWYCADCKKYFSDENLTKEIEKDSWIIKAGHNLEKHDAIEANCEQNGQKEYYTCTNCQTYFADKDGKNTISALSWIINKHPNIRKISAKSATCTSAGNLEYWYCPDCNRCYSDEQCKEEIVKDSWTIKALGHSYKTKSVGGGCSYKYCTRCNYKTSYTSPSYVKSFKVSKGSKSFTAKWKKQSKSTQKKFTGYRIRYSTKSNMSGAKTVYVKKSASSKTISKLSKKKKYYVEICSYVKKGSNKYYSKVSKASVTTK